MQIVKIYSSDVESKINKELTEHPNYKINTLAAYHDALLVVYDIMGNNKQMLNEDFLIKLP